MPMFEYRSLCPNSGHVVDGDDRAESGADGCDSCRTRTIRCAACGRTVKAQPDPGTRQFLIYPMHERGIE